MPFPSLRCLLGVLLVIASAVSIYFLMASQSEAERGLRTWTIQQLSLHDGRDESKILLLSIGGFVFDVSEGHRFYGVGSPYHCFAGRAATRALTISSLDESDITDDVSDFNEAQTKEMKERIDFYLSKYPVVGYLQGTQFDVGKIHVGDRLLARNSEKEDASDKVDTIFSDVSLARYNGHCQTPEGPCRSIYLAVSGEVFNVSSLRALYGPGAPRSSMAGKGVTRTLVLLHNQERSGGDSLSRSGADDRCELLSQEEREVALAHVEHFRKFHGPRVGLLDSFFERPCDVMNNHVNTDL